MDQITIQRVSDLVDSLRDEMVEMSLAIHDHPELGHQEFFAKGLQVEKLRHYGFEVEENYCDIPTAYRAVYKGKSPARRSPCWRNTTRCPSWATAVGTI